MSKHKNSRFFQGEIMICGACGRIQRSNPAIESMWTIIEIERNVQYVCPQCWGVADKDIPPESKITSQDKKQ